MCQQLHEHSTRWKEIGNFLGFSQGELNNIEASPVLFMEGPQSLLAKILVNWFRWDPDDYRGSTSFATLETLKEALVMCGLASTADNLHIDPGEYISVCHM